MTLGYPTGSDMVWGWKVKVHGHRVNKCIYHNNEYYAYDNAHLTDNCNTIQCGFALHEWLLVTTVWSASINAECEVWSPAMMWLSYKCSCYCQNSVVKSFWQLHWILSHVVHVVQVKLALKWRMKLRLKLIVMMSLSIHMMTSQGRMCVHCVRNDLQGKTIWKHTEKDILERSCIHVLSVRNALQLRAT